MSLDVRERLEDGLWDWGWCGDVVSYGHEAVLVSDVGDGYPCTIRSGVAVGALCGLGLCLWVAGVLQVALLLGLDLVAGFISGMLDFVIDHLDRNR